MPSSSTSRTPLDSGENQMTTAGTVLARHIQRRQAAGKSIVAVDGRAGHTSSGIVWRRDAVLTAAHAIRQETKIGVILGPGQVVTGRLAGRDRGTHRRGQTGCRDSKLPRNSADNVAVRRRIHRRRCADPAWQYRGQRRNHRRSDGGTAGLGRTRIDQFIRPDC